MSQQVQPVRFVMIGGFLGAGKTTTIARLARHFISQGQAVAVVTNDQAEGLVDTQILQAAGLSVGEVPGACFCCKFDDLVQTVSRLAQEVRPQVILAEPVGSCTDLVATVVEPLRRLYPGQYVLAPLVVLLKPEHAFKILRHQRGFSPKAAYIFHKQLEEADVVAVNKIDKLSPQQVEELRQLIARQYPGKPVLAISARGGTGIPELIEHLQTSYQGPSRLMDVDYDLYAQGEAELGWLNCSFYLSSRYPEVEDFSLDELAQQYLELLAEKLHDQGEVCHVKIAAGHETDLAVANWTSNDSPRELSLASGVRVPEAHVTLNARVAVDPQELEHLARQCAEEVAGRWELVLDGFQSRSFRPARPVPTHRVTQLES